MNRLFNIFIKWPGPAILILLLLTIPFGYFFLHKSFFNNVRLYFDSDDPAIVAYEQFQETYGNEEVAIIVLHAEDIFTAKILGMVRDISSMAKTSEGVQRVFSLTEATEAVGQGDAIAFEPLIPQDPLDAEGLKAVRAHLLQKEFVTQTLVSKTGDTTAIVLELERIASAETKGAILNRITTQAEEIVGGDARLYFSGTPFVEYEINALTQRDDKVFTPIVIGLIFIMALLSIKRLSLSLLCIVNLFITLVWMVGLFVWTGHRFNMVTVVMPPMLLTASMTATIHILMHFNTLYKAGESRLQAIRETIANLWFPCLFTSLTTAVGFISFITTPIGPLRTLGIFAAIGAMLAFLMAILVLPALVVLFGGKPVKAGAAHTSQDPPRLGWDINHGVDIIRQLTIRHSWKVMIVFAIVMTVAVIGAFRIRYETNFANHLDEDNKVKQGIRFIEKNLFGTVPVALLIRSEAPEYDFTHPESLKLLVSIQSALQRDFSGAYTSFFSIADYFKEMHRAFNQNQEAFYVIPADAGDILDYYELAETDILDRVVSADRREARISFNAYLGPIGGSKKLDRYLAALLPRAGGGRYSYRVTGSSSLYAAMDQNLKECLLNSFTSAFVVIFFMIHLVCRNWKLTLISMPPNLFPILGTFGLMGFLDIPLDVSTVMIASITIGIAVDDTIHFMVWFRRNSLAGMQTREALMASYKNTGKEILATALILCIAFSTFLAGSVLPVRAFGSLTALSLALALLGDLLLLPALIMIFKPKIQAGSLGLNAAAAIARFIRKNRGAPGESHSRP
ncbi:MAG: MMPL family transporter [Desulfobacterales bacterium]|nr:MMPL family transporter [Desulfobacterales bacterium]